MKNPERFFSPKVNTEFDAARAKIIIGDFLARCEEPCTAAELREILTVNDTVIAYFTYVEAYEQMLANSMIELDANGCVRLTETGKRLVPELSEFTSEKLRERALASAENYFREKKTERDTNVLLVQDQDSFGARCECFDNGTTLMRVTLWYDDRELADFMRSLMNVDPVGLYCDVLDRVLGIKTELMEFSAESPMDRTLAQGVRGFIDEHSECVNECGSETMDKGVEVLCRCSDADSGQLLMELEVYAPDERQAEYLCESLTRDKMIFCLVGRLVLQNLGKQEEM